MRHFYRSCVDLSVKVLINAVPVHMDFKFPSTNRELRGFPRLWPEDHRVSVYAADVDLLSYLSHSKAIAPRPIASSTTGFATSSPFSLFANITTPDFVLGSAITNALNEPLSPQCQSTSAS